MKKISFYGSIIEFEASLNILALIINLAFYIMMVVIPIASSKTPFF